MSRIVALRTAVIEALRTAIPDLAHVDWHDGEFDENDVEEITTLTPAAYITVINAPSEEQLTTRQMNASVRCYVNIICSDADGREERGSDPQVWDLMEKTAILANLNHWGVEGCAVGQNVRFKRLRDPKLRRQGIAVGCVEWTNGLILGENAILKRDFLEDPTTTLAEAGATFTVTSRRRVDGMPIGDVEGPFDATIPADDPRRIDHEIY